MSRQTLKDAQFRVLGYIDTAADGKQTARDAHFRVLGYYEPSRDVTKDASFRVIGHGNMLASLIRCD